MHSRPQPGGFSWCWLSQFTICLKVNVEQFTSSRVSRCNAPLSRRHRPRGGAETDLGLVPAAGLRLAQVGHLRVSGPQVGQVRGKLPGKCKEKNNSSLMALDIHYSTLTSEMLFYHHQIIYSGSCFSRIAIHCAMNLDNIFDIRPSLL